MTMFFHYLEKYYNKTATFVWQNTNFHMNKISIVPLNTPHWLVYALVENVMNLHVV